MKDNVDTSNMHKVIMDAPDQLEKGLSLAKNTKIEGNVSNIIICGIGGSALPADILISLNKTNIPIYIHRDYNLPSTAGENSLIVCISYSGNTEETISALKEAIAKKLKIIGFSSGGEIESICNKNNILFTKIPSGIQPRCATGYIFSSLIKVLMNSGIIEDISSEIMQTIQTLKEINVSLEKEGEKLAKKILKKIPVVYSSNNLKELARIWKIKFNENSKIPAFYNYFPELNHNEMVGYSGLKKLGAKNFHIIILQDTTDHPRILKRMQLTSNVIKKSGAKVEIIHIRDGSFLLKIFSTLLLGDWTSYHLALLQNIDPTPVKIVEEFKEQLKK